MLAEPLAAAASFDPLSVALFSVEAASPAGGYPVGFIYDTTVGTGMGSYFLRLFPPARGLLLVCRRNMLRPFFSIERLIDAVQERSHLTRVEVAGLELLEHLRGDLDDLAVGLAMVLCGPA